MKSLYETKKNAQNGIESFNGAKTPLKKSK